MPVNQYGNTGQSPYAGAGDTRYPVYGGAGGPNAANGTDPLSGFAGQQGYNPSLLNQTIWDSPWAILPDVFRGLPTTSPGYQALRDFGADPLTLYNIMAGANNDLASAGVGGYTNWLANLYGQMGTAGGRAFNARELLNNIFGQQFGQNGESNTALGRIMSSGDMGTQVRTLFNLLREVSNAGMNPLAARGYQSAVARAGDTYQNQMLHNNAGNTQMMSQWLLQNFPSLAGR